MRRISSQCDHFLGERQMKIYRSRRSTNGSQLTSVHSEILLFFFIRPSNNSRTSTEATILNEQVFSSRSVSMLVMPSTAFKSLRTEASQPVHVIFGRLIETWRNLSGDSTFDCFFLPSPPWPGSALEGDVCCPMKISSSTNLSTPLNI